MLKRCASENGMRGSCMMPRWMTASIRSWRKTSSSFFLRMSTWWWVTSLGCSRKGRRSMPTSRVSVGSCLASALPRLPEMPVMATERGMPGKVMAGRGWGTGGLLPEDVLALGEAAPQEPVDGGLDRVHLALQLGVVVVGRAVEADG